VIDKNRNQLRKTLFSSKDAGEKIRVFKAYTDREEASMVVDDLYGLLRGRQVAYRDTAILYRTNAQSRVLEESLRQRNIPYKIYGGQSFYQRKEIKDVLAYIRLAVNHKDDEALRRIINYPTRGIGDVTIDKVAATAAKHGVSMWEVISTLTPEQMGLRGAAGGKIAEFREMIAELSASVPVTPAYEMGLKIATRSGIIGIHRMQSGPEAMSVLENIEELLNSIAAFAEQQQSERPDEPATIVEWLQNVALLTDMDNDKPEDRNRVSLMTIHSAKGLEFDYVYIVGLEETLFPSQLTTDSPEALEEERRLFYVALTRARKEAILTFASSRFRWGNVTYNRPSRFIAEIDERFLDRQYDTGSDNFAPQPESPGHFGSFGAREPKSHYPPRPTRGGDPAPKKPEGVVRNFTIPHPAMRSMGTRPKEDSPVQSAPSAPASNAALAIGARVAHDKFGAGTVTDYEQTANGPKATVDFDAAGAKTLLLKYARLRIIEN
jgi:DNA helicase-2/ATP-dependent DNA helicase PcrA